MGRGCEVEHRLQKRREPTDVYRGRSVLGARDPQPSDLASLDLVPHNPQRKCTPYTLIPGRLALQLGDWQKENNSLERTFMHSPGVLLCVSL